MNRAPNRLQPAPPSPTTAPETMRCTLCDASGLAEDRGFPSLPQVTSDCRPWPAGGRLACCPACGAVQKPWDAAFAARVRDIYADYALYYQGQGREQRIFHPAGLQSQPRSELLLDLVLPHLPDGPGVLLDIGCGQGHFLRNVAARRPGWRLHGLDQNPAYRKAVLSVPGAEAFHLGGLDQIPERFDLVSLNHSLEHMPRPVDVLRQARLLLRPGGALLVNVPDHSRNPFDLVVADHHTHFTAATLGLALENAGFAARLFTEPGIPKELAALAEPGAAKAAPLTGEPEPGAAPDRVRSILGWLERFAALADGLSAERLCIFGAANAGVWLCSLLGERAACFVDEDPQRVGRTILGRPIIAPDRIPPGDTVVLPFPPGIARSIAARLRGLPVHAVLPPDLDGAPAAGESAP